MEINKVNNLLELFYKQYLTQDKPSVFLQSLKEVEKKYSWEDVYLNVIKLSEEISKYIKKGDRCLLISENRQIMKNIGKLKPIMPLVIVNTLKGKGVNPARNKVASHT